MKEKTVPAFMELTLLLGYQTSISEIWVIVCGTCSGYNRYSERKEIYSTKVVRKLFLERVSIEGPYKEDLSTSF